MSVTVRRPLFYHFDSKGAWSEDIYARCEADVFEAGVLTITCVDDDRVMQTYQPGQWIEAVATDPRGHIHYSLRPTHPAHPERQSA